MVRASQRTGAGPSKDILNSDDSVASARPYGEAVQSNVLYVTLVAEKGQGSFLTRVALLPRHIAF